MAIIDNIRHYWKLDESSGNVTGEVDSYVMTNISTATFGAGLINNGAILNGISQYFINTGTAWNASLPGAVSYNVWVNPTNLPSSGNSSQLILQDDSRIQAFISLTNTGGTQEVHFRVFGSSGSTELIEVVTLSTGSWAMITGTWDGSNIRLYIDSTLVEGPTGRANIGQGTSSGNVFGANTAGNQKLDGKLDEIGYWEKELVQSEITALYNGGAGLAYPLTEISGPANLKTIGTTATANIKTVNGIAIASIKSINTIV